MTTPPLQHPADPLRPEPPPSPSPRFPVCPYCGEQPTGPRCNACGGLAHPLSQQASQNEMGPWFIRDPDSPFLPGFSFDTLRRLVAKRRIIPRSVIRGPTTRQFWTAADATPGVANLLGACHACRSPVDPSAPRCAACGASFEVPHDRQRLGLVPVRLLPGHASPDEIVYTLLKRHPPTGSPAADGRSAFRGNPDYVAAAPPSPAPGSLDPPYRRPRPWIVWFLIGLCVVETLALVVLWMTSGGA